jgi:hypothetical protein
MDLVYECFAKLGLRYICVLRDGQYAGMVIYSSRSLPSANHVTVASKDVCKVCA